jgi:hypothetical protein
VEYNCSLIKVDWLAACTYSTKVVGTVGTVFVVFLRHWRKICTIRQSMGSKGRYLKKSTKPCWPITSKETWVKGVDQWEKRWVNLVSFHWSRFKLFTLKFSKESGGQTLSCERPKTAQQRIIDKNRNRVRWEV